MKSKPKTRRDSTEESKKSQAPTEAIQQIKSRPFRDDQKHNKKFIRQFKHFPTPLKENRLVGGLPNFQQQRRGLAFL